jgi:hypothetical protein
MAQAARAHALAPPPPYPHPLYDVYLDAHANVLPNARHHACVFTLTAARLRSFLSAACDNGVVSSVLPSKRSNAPPSHARATLATFADASVHVAFRQPFKDTFLSVTFRKKGASLPQLRGPRAECCGARPELRFLRSADAHIPAQTILSNMQVGWHAPAEPNCFQ